MDGNLSFLAQSRFTMFQSFHGWSLPCFYDFLIEDVIKILASKTDKTGDPVRWGKPQTVAGENLQGRFPVH